MLQTMQQSNNKVFLSGIVTDFEFNYEFLNHKYYLAQVKVMRLSQKEDEIPVIMSDVIIGSLVNDETLVGRWIDISGEFRSSNRRDETGKSHLYLYVYAKKINIYMNEKTINANKCMRNNCVSLDGYICKHPVFRKTPLDRRITDMILAVNRPYHSSDYIPCILWDEKAEISGNFEVGTRIQVQGRLQSRMYFKRYSPDTNEGEYRKALEVSVYRMDVLFNK